MDATKGALGDLQHHDAVGFDLLLGDLHRDGLVTTRLVRLFQGGAGAFDVGLGAVRAHERVNRLLDQIGREGFGALHPVFLDVEGGGRRGGRGRRGDGGVGGVGGVRFRRRQGRREPAGQSEAGDAAGRGQPAR